MLARIMLPYEGFGGSGFEDSTLHSFALACAGSAGKSTTCWYARGIFEDWALPGSDPPSVCMVGMAGSLENAVDVLRMDRQGNLWEPEEDDPTLERFGAGSCTAALGSFGRPVTRQLEDDDPIPDVRERVV